MQVALERWLRCKLNSDLGDRGGMVADALELINDVIHHQEIAKVTRHRTLRGDGGRDRRDHLVLHVVDLAIANDDGLSLLGVVRDKRIEGVSDCRLRHASHADNGLLDGAELAVERLAGTLWGRRGSVACGAGEDLLDLAFHSALVVSCWHFSSKPLVELVPILPPQPCEERISVHG